MQARIITETRERRRSSSLPQIIHLQQELDSITASDSTSFQRRQTLLVQMDTLESRQLVAQALVISQNRARRLLSSVEGVIHLQQELDSTIHAGGNHDGFQQRQALLDQIEALESAERLAAGQGQAARRQEGRDAQQRYEDSQARTHRIRNAEFIPSDDDDEMDDADAEDYIPDSEGPPHDQRDQAAPADPHSSGRQLFAGIDDDSSSTTSDDELFRLSTTTTTTSTRYTAAVAGRTSAAGALLPTSGRATGMNGGVARGRFGSTSNNNDMRGRFGSNNNNSSDDDSSTTPSEEELFGLSTTATTSAHLAATAAWNMVGATIATGGQAHTTGGGMTARHGQSSAAAASAPAFLAAAATGVNAAMTNRLNHTASATGRIHHTASATNHRNHSAQSTSATSRLNHSTSANSRHNNAVALSRRNNMAAAATSRHNNAATGAGSSRHGSNVAMAGNVSAAEARSSSNQLSKLPDFLDVENNNIFVLILRACQRDGWENSLGHSMKTSWFLRNTPTFFDQAQMGFLSSYVHFTFFHLICSTIFSKMISTNHFSFPYSSSNTQIPASSGCTFEDTF
jgi:hypothetical protein